MVIEDYKRLMKKQRVTPDMLIMAPSSSLYLSMVQPRTVEYWGLSNGGYEYKQGPSSISTLRELDIFETRDFDVYHDEPAIDLLTKRTQIGERYEMVFRDWKNNKIHGYESKWRDIYIYNENKDAMEKITFKNAFMHTNTFDAEGNPHKMIKEMIARMKDGKGPTRNGKKYPGERGYGVDIVDKEHPHPLITKDSQNMATLVEYFGQMDLHNATSKDFEQMGQTVIAKVYGCDGKEMLLWNDMIKLLRQIEGQKYNREYFKRLIQANITHSLDENGRFVGELTPSDLVEHWHMLSQIKEWVPSPLGSLFLPEKPSGVLYPAGLANGPGLLQIANEVNNENSTWKHIAKRAETAVDLISRLVDVLKIVAPTSEAIEAKNRSPWWHKSDSFTTFVETVVSIPRDPVYLAALPIERRGDGKPVGMPKGGKTANNNKINWTSKALFVLQDAIFDGGRIRDVEEIKEMIKMIQAKRLPAGLSPTPDRYEYTRPSGTKVSLQAANFKYAFLVPKEIMAFQLMGEESFVALARILQALIGRGADTNKILNFILHYTGSGGNSDRLAMIRKIVLGLAQNTDPAILSANIGILYLTEKSSEKDRKTAQTKIKKLTHPFENVVDSDIPDFKPPEPIPAFELDASGENALPEKFKSGLADVSDIYDQVMQLTDELGAARKTLTLPVVTFDLESDADWITNPGTDNADYLAKVAQARELIESAEEKLGSSGLLAAEKEIIREDQMDFHTKEVAGEVKVLDGRDDVAGAVFYRAPLTMSLELLDSMTMDQQPLIRPSDPRTGHITFFDPSMSRGDPNAELEEIYSRPNYAHIDALNNGTKPKPFELTNFIQRHVGVQFGSADDEPIPKIGKRKPMGNQMKIGTKKHKGMFSCDSDDDDQMDDDYEKKKKMDEDEHYDSEFEEPKGGWSLQNLRKQGNRGEVNKRIPFQTYGELYSKVFTGIFKHRFEAANEIADPLLRSAVIALLMTPANGKQCERMIDNNIHVPFNILLWRLCIEHDMSSAIMLKRGLETGANLYGHSNFVTGKVSFLLLGLILKQVTML